MVLLSKATKITHILCIIYPYPYLVLTQINTCKNTPYNLQQHPATQPLRHTLQIFLLLNRNFSPAAASYSRH